jgi:hypothetical protein
MSRATRSRAAAIAALGALGVAAACSDERTTVLEPQSIQYGFALLADGRNLPGGTVQYRRPATTAAAATVDTAVIITLRGLDSLPNNVYQVWLADTTTAGTALANVIKATGTMRVIRTDSALDPQGDIVTTENIVTTTGVSSFKNGGPATRVELTVTRASLGLGATGVTPLTRALVIVSIETDGAATEPGTLRPLWARRAERSAEVVFNQPGSTPPIPLSQTATSIVRFGNFGIRSSQEYNFRAVGRGRAVIGEDFVVLDDSALMRPPIGYYFAGAAIKRDAANKAVDTLDLGPQTAPLPRRNISLREADVSIPDPVVQVNPPSIIAAANRVSVDTIAGFQAQENPFRGFADVYVTLENKLGVPNSPAPPIILAGVVPSIVRSGPATP